MDGPHAGPSVVRRVNLRRLGRTRSIVGPPGGPGSATKPGLTGWAQINYPYGNTVEDASQKLQYDIFYIKYQSLLFDLSILFNTIKTVVLRKGT